MERTLDIEKVKEVLQELQNTKLIQPRYFLDSDYYPDIEIPIIEQIPPPASPKTHLKYAGQYVISQQKKGFSTEEDATPRSIYHPIIALSTQPKKVDKKQVVENPRAKSFHEKQVEDYQKEWLKTRVVMSIQKEVKSLPFFDPVEATDVLDAFFDKTISLLVHMNQTKLLANFEHKKQRYEAMSFFVNSVSEIRYNLLSQRFKDGKIDLTKLSPDYLEEFEEFIPKPSEEDILTQEIIRMNLLKEKEKKAQKSDDIELKIYAKMPEMQLRLPNCYHVTQDQLINATNANNQFKKRLRERLLTAQNQSRASLAAKEVPLRNQKSNTHNSLTHKTPNSQNNNLHLNISSTKNEIKNENLSSKSQNENNDSENNNNNNENNNNNNENNNNNNENSDSNNNNSNNDSNNNDNNNDSNNNDNNNNDNDNNYNYSYFNNNNINYFTDNYSYFNMNKNRNSSTRRGPRILLTANESKRVGIKEKQIEKAESRENLNREQVTRKYWKENDPIKEREGDFQNPLEFISSISHQLQYDLPPPVSLQSLIPFPLDSNIEDLEPKKKSERRETPEVSETVEESHDEEEEKKTGKKTEREETEKEENEQTEKEEAEHDPNAAPSNYTQGITVKYASSSAVNQKYLKFLLDSSKRLTGNSGKGIYDRLEGIWNKLGFSTIQKLEMAVKYSKDSDDTGKLGESLKIWESAKEAVDNYERAYSNAKDFIRHDKFTTQRPELVMEMLNKELETTQDILLSIAQRLKQGYNDDLILHHKTVNNLIEMRRRKLYVLWNGKNNN